MVGWPSVGAVHKGSPDGERTALIGEGKEGGAAGRRGSDEVVLGTATADGVQGEAVEAAAEQPPVPVADRNHGEALAFQDLD